MFVLLDILPFYSRYWLTTFFSNLILMWIIINFYSWFLKIILFYLFLFRVFRRRQFFYRKRFLKISHDSQEYTCAESFLIKLETFRPATLLKRFHHRRLQHTYFPVNIMKFFKAPILWKTFASGCFCRWIYSSKWCFYNAGTVLGKSPLTSSI